MIVHFSHGRHIHLVLRGKFHPEILKAPFSGASNKGGVGKQATFSFVRQYLEQDSCAIAKMTARCVLYKLIVSRCGDMAI